MLHFWPSGHRIQQRLPWLRLKLLVNLLFRPPLSPEAGCRFPPRTESRRGLNCGAEDETASSCSLPAPGTHFCSAWQHRVTLWEGRNKNGTCSCVVNSSGREEKSCPLGLLFFLCMCVYSFDKTSQEFWKKGASFSFPPITCIFFIFLSKIT